MQISHLVMQSYDAFPSILVGSDPPLSSKLVTIDNY